MKNFAFLLLAVSVWGQTPPSPAPAAQPPAAAAAAADPVVLTVGTQKITKSEFERIVATLPAQAQAQVKAPGGLKQLGEQLAELIMLAQEAKARKLDQTPMVRTRIEIETDQVLANAIYQSLGTTDEGAMQAYYDAHKGDMEQVHARHILIRFKGSQVPLADGKKDLTEDEALQKCKELRAKIAGGAKFEDVAKAESDDSGSGANGGDLDTFGRGAMVPEFEKAAFELKPGELSQPVRSAFGYHLILVDSHTTKSYEDAKPEIAKAVGPAAADKAVQDLKSKATIVLDDSYFK